jgi:hypothetical protein
MPAPKWQALRAFSVILVSQFAAVELQGQPASSSARSSQTAMQSPADAELQPGAGEVFQRLPPIPPAPVALELADESAFSGDGAESLTLEMLEQLACANNPTLGQAQAQIQGTFRNIFVRVGAGHNFEAEQGVGLAEITMQVPLWDRNQGTIRQARADLARQQAEIRRIELMLRRELGTVYDQYLTALQQVEALQLVILPESRRAYEVRLDSYQDNRERWTEVLAAEKGYFTARVQHLEQQSLLRESEVLLVGYLLHGGLMTPERPTPSQHIDVAPKPR